MREGAAGTCDGVTAEGCPRAGVMRVGLAAVSGARLSVAGCARLVGELVLRTRVERGANSRNCQKGRGAPPNAEMKSISVIPPSRIRAVISCAVRPRSTVPSERWRLKSDLGGVSDKVGGGDWGL